MNEYFPSATSVSTMSKEAIAFHRDAAMPSAWSLSKSGVEKLRADERKEAAQNNVAIVEKYVQQLSESTIAGIPVLVITPKGYDDRNDDKAVVFFFGGAFVLGSPHVDLPISARLAQLLGVKVYSPYYRLAPEHPCPAAIDDGFAVYESMLGEFAAGNVVFSGESAGGNLALAVMLRIRERGLAMPAAAALMSPWCDVTPAGLSQREPANFDPTLDYESQLKPAAAAYCGAYNATDPTVSPVYANYDGRFPATLITSGTRELFLSDCARLSTSMRQSGVDVRLHVWEGMWHSFEWYVDIPEAERSMIEIANFLRRRLSDTGD